MIIKLEFKKETDKAYQLENNSWIPKSILDNRGLKHPYYQIKDWWLAINVENIMTPSDKLKYLGRKKTPTADDIEYSNNCLLGLKPLAIQFSDIPDDIKDYWKNFWSSLSSDFGNSCPDYEPRMWGNDCYDVDNMA